MKRIEQQTATAGIYTNRCTPLENTLVPTENSTRETIQLRLQAIKDGYGVMGDRNRNGSLRIEQQRNMIGLRHATSKSLLPGRNSSTNTNSSLKINTKTRSSEYNTITSCYAIDNDHYTMFRDPKSGKIAANF
jgi:hypothetical protein